MSDVKIIELTLAAAVPTAGTFTVGYPTGTTRGTFLKGKNHKFVAQGATFEAPTDFTISFGTTTATITYNGTTTLAQGAAVRVQLDVQGEDTLKAYQGLASSSVQALQPLLVNLGSPILFDIDSIIDAATGTELPDSTPTTITYTQANIGTSPCDGVNTTWVFETPRNVTMTVTHNSSIVACEARLIGVDDFGAIMAETLAVTATGTTKTATGVKAFKELTSITLYGAADISANTIEIGHGSAIGLPVYLGDILNVLSEIENGVIVGGAPNAPIRLNWFGDSVSVLAGTAAAIELVAPCAGVITTLGVVTRVAVTTGGNVTVKVGTTDVLGLTVAVANSSTKGTTTTDTPTGSDTTHIVAKGDRIQIVFDDAFATAGALDGYLDIRPTGLQFGTLAAGLSPATKSTATTADVRGTYTSPTTLDGSVAIALMVAVADPTFLGNPQYEG